jgi:hypothetical protein
MLSWRKLFTNLAIAGGGVAGVSLSTSSSLSDSSSGSISCTCSFFWSLFLRCFKESINLVNKKLLGEDELVM